METITMKLNSPITDEQWNIITDAELEHSDEIEFTTPSGKKVVYAKVRHGKWIECEYENGINFHRCSVCGQLDMYRGIFTDSGDRGFIFYYKRQYCPNCGAKMDEVNDEN